jgi:hypothetical protein
VLLLAIMPFFSAAQKKYEYAPDAAGKWTYTYLNESKGSYRSDANYVLSPAELAAFKKKINVVAETLHQNPVTQSFIGYEATISAGIYANMYRYKYNVANLAGRIPKAEIILRFCPLHREIASGRIFKDCMEVEHCDVWLNSMERTVTLYGDGTIEPFDKLNALDEAAAKMNAVFQAPEVFQQPAAGVTLYTNGVMIFAKPGRPYWLPVTAGEYFDLKIKYWTLQSEKEGNRMFLDMLLQEKANFSKADLKLPAYNGEYPASLISVIPNNRPYMRLNPGYFDKQLLRTALQLITVKLNNDILIEGFNPDEYLKGEHYMDILRYYQYSKAIDVEKIKALLDIP